MAKIHARNAGIFIGGRDISGRSNSATFTQNADAPDVTAFQDPNRERLSSGITDVELSVNGFFDAAASQVDALFSSLVTASAQIGFYPDTSGASKPGRETRGVLTEYGQEYSTDGAAATSVTISGCGTVFLVTSLGHASVSDTSASVLPSVDFSGSAASNFGYLRILELDGTNPEVSASLQHSNDDASFTTVIDFGTASAADVILSGSYTSASRYRRLRYILAGTSPSAKLQATTGSNI